MTILNFTIIDAKSHINKNMFQFYENVVSNETNIFEHITCFQIYVFTTL